MTTQSLRPPLELEARPTHTHIYIIYMYCGNGSFTRFMYRRYLEPRGRSQPFFFSVVSSLCSNTSSRPVLFFPSRRKKKPYPMLAPQADSGQSCEIGVSIAFGSFAQGKCVGVEPTGIPRQLVAVPAPLYSCELFNPRSCTRFPAAFSFISFHHLTFPYPSRPDRISPYPAIPHPCFLAYSSAFFLRLC